ncbi:MAG: response regulator receiver protein [Polyangiaceae bacterium]|jgi:HD-like signal output (HDOD) protein|nr:response regulator receiver protein [Polyangiaceae bacterium]
MKVLFVDDEPRVLQALRRSLAIANVPWDARFVDGGAAALAALASEPYDVVVTDMRMPSVDGAAVLNAARDRDPGIVRIVLSGQADEAAALRVVRVAHQFLAKPCDVKLLRHVVERTGALHQALADPNLRAMVGSVDRLPSSLRIFQELSELLVKEDASVERVSELVQQDPAMASKLLQFVNSAFFAHSREIADVRSAVIRLGMKSVKNLVLGLGVFDTVGRWKLPQDISIEEMQLRAFTTARIAGACMPDRLQADAAYMAGLVCDIGELVLAATLPAQLTQAWSVAATDAAKSRPEAEREVFGVSHAEVGGCLLGLWGLPFRVVEAVALHHTPELCPTSLGLPAVVWLASCVAAGQEPNPARVEALGVGDVLKQALAVRG